MKRLARVTSLAAWSLLLACDAPTAAEHSAPTPLADRLAGGSSCYPVAFELAGPRGVGPFAAVLTGDLVGSVVSVFDLPASLKFAGHTISNAGTATWTISGGVLPTPLTFTTAFENRNLVSDNPASPATIFENIGTHRATSGVSTANLHYRGTFDATTRLVLHHYRGVVCL